MDALVYVNQCEEVTNQINEYSELVRVKLLICLLFSIRARRRRGRKKSREEGWKKLTQEARGGGGGGGVQLMSTCHSKVTCEVAVT